MYSAARGASGGRALALERRAVAGFDAGISSPAGFALLASPTRRPPSRRHGKV